MARGDPRGDAEPVSATSVDPNVEFTQYGEILRRRWKSIAFGVILGLLLAGAALALLPKTYESTASVLVNAVGTTNGSVENGRTTSSLNLDTEAQIVTSSVVAKLAAERLGSKDSLTDLAKQASVSVPANTSVLDITFSGATPAQAQDGARAFAEAYLDNRKTLVEDTTTQQQTRLQDRIDALGEQVLTLGETIDKLPQGSAQRSFQNSRRQLLLRQIAGINDQFSGLDAGDSNPGNVITDPQVPAAPASPNIPILLGSGLLVGILAGVLLAFTRDRRDKGVRDRRDLERAGLDPLVPSVAVPPPGLVASATDAQHDADSMRMLRNALLAQMPGHRGSVMVAAASAGTAGSSVALNLAATLARSGLDVILASADSRTGQSQAGEADRQGLADVVQGRAALGDVLHGVQDVPGLRTVSPGTDGSLYSELVQSERLQSMMAELAHRAEILVVDVAPVSVNADAQSLASQFDGVVLVAETGTATVDDLSEAIDQFRHVGARVFGAVVAHQSTSAGSAVPSYAHDG